MTLGTHDDASYQLDAQGTSLVSLLEATRIIRMNGTGLRQYSQKIGTIL